MNKTKIIEKLELDELSLKILNSALSYYDENYELIDLSDYPLLKNKKELNLFKNTFNPVKDHDAKINSNHDLKKEFLDPIFLILNSKKFSQDVLNKLEKINPKDKDELIMIRMYKEYLKMLDEVFDKWNSLRLLEKLGIKR
tara:strand:+ start:1399 stop:1821 length:423 start_codon:yes stop_codon:yes gene_type:complete